MPLTYSVVFHHLMDRRSPSELRQCLLKLCFLLLLSFFTSIVINNLLPLVIPTMSPSPSLSSSSLSSFSTYPLFFPSKRTLHQELQQSTSVGKKRTYTKDYTREKNVSTGNISNSLLNITICLPSFILAHRQEAESALHIALELIVSKKYEKARKVFEHALLLDPSNFEILLEYGQFFENHQQDLIRAEHFYTRALVKQPDHHRALELKKRTLPLVEEIDQKHFNLIDSLLKEFYRIPDTNPYLRRAKRDAYYLHIYHTNAIEGNTLSLRETRYIVETRLAIGGKSLVEQQEVLGLDQALQYVNSTLVNRLEPITRDDILDIHRRVFGYVDPIHAGQLRKHQVYVGSFIPPSAEETSDYLDDFIQWLNSSEDTQDMHVIELAAIAHYKFVYIHPFIDGNGRTGRLLMNLILMRSGFPPVIIRKSDRLTYYSHLDEANAGDVRPLIRFLAKCTERTLTQFIHQSQPMTSHRQGLRLNSEEEEDEKFIEERVIMVD